MGGALSEMSAFRCVSLHPVLRDKVHVLSFGSIPWANAPLALSYDEFFGRRSVQLVLCRRARGRRPGLDVVGARARVALGAAPVHLHDTAGGAPPPRP